MSQREKIMLQSKVGELRTAVAPGDPALAEDIQSYWDEVYSLPLPTLKKEGTKLIERAKTIAGPAGEKPFATAGDVRRYAFELEDKLDYLTE